MRTEVIEPMIATEENKDENGTINPFLQDAYHMGTYLGKNVCVMSENHTSEECKYLIVVDMRTGKRLKITF